MNIKIRISAASVLLVAGCFFQFGSKERFAIGDVRKKRSLVSYAKGVTWILFVCFNRPRETNTVVGRERVDIHLPTCLRLS